MDAEDGRLFIRHLAYYIRTHERALANASQQRQPPRSGQSQSDGLAPPPIRRAVTQPISSTTSTSLATALSIGWGSAQSKPAKLYLTPNQLYFLLSRFEELGVSVGPMNVRLESISSDSTPLEYVSFLSQARRPKGRSPDQDSLHSVSSVRSVMSSVTSMWSNLGISSNNAQKEEKRKAVELEDVKYLYSAFTKIPCLKLGLDHRIRRIKGYEEFPFDTAVPIWAFKNLSVLEVVDLDFRSFFGWDRLAEQLRSLTLKRAGVEDLTDVLTNIVLDDMDKRRKRSAKASSPVMAYASPSAAMRKAELARSYSGTESSSPRRSSDRDKPSSESSHGGLSSSARPNTRTRNNSASPSRRRRSSAHLYAKPVIRQRRSSSSSSSNARQTPRTSSSNLLSFHDLPVTKWRFLRHLSIADNALTSMEAHSLAPLMQSLQSFDLSSNLFTEIPDSLASLASLRALNLSNCMISSLHSLIRNPLPAITVLNLRGNRLQSLAGIERLPSLERLDLRENHLRDPSELARLTGMPNFREVFVAKNPFVRSHATYRVTIFNLFRQSFGYSEDVIIDTTGPSYGERKYLSDRTLEPRTVPVVKPPFEEEEEVEEQRGDRVKVDLRHSSPVRKLDPAPVIEEDRAREPQTPQTPTRSSNRSGRKAPRRRVVDMSQGESPRTPPSASTYTGSLEATPTFVTAIQTPLTSNAKPIGRSRSTRKPSWDGEPMSPVSTPPERPRQHRPLSPPRSDLRTDLNMSSEQYRRHIETLKQEHGSSWLSALNSDADPFYRKDAVPSPGAVS